MVDAWKILSMTEQISIPIEVKPEESFEVKLSKFSPAVKEKLASQELVRLLGRESENKSNNENKSLS